MRPGIVASMPVPVAAVPVAMVAVPVAMVATVVVMRTPMIVMVIVMIVAKAGRGKAKVQGGGQAGEAGEMFHGTDVLSKDGGQGRCLQTIFADFRVAGKERSFRRPLDEHRDGPSEGLDGRTAEAGAFPFPPARAAVLRANAVEQGAISLAAGPDVKARTDRCGFSRRPPALPLPSPLCEDHSSWKS